MQGVKYDESVVIEKIKERLSIRNMEFISFDGEYKNTRKTKANVKCKICGYTDKLPVDSIINRDFGCKRCNKHAPIFCGDDLKKKCESMGHEFIGFVGGEYKNGKSKLIYRCGKCGKLVTVKCRNFMKDCYRGCCKEPQRLSGKEYLDRLKEICKNNSYELLMVSDNEEKVNVRTRVKYKCGICGNVTETDIGHIVNEGTRCPGCVGGSTVNSHLVRSRIEKRCSELNCTFIGFYNEENEYKNNITKLLVKCNVCGYEWKPTYAHFIRDTGCPQCGGSRKLTKEEALSRSIEFGKLHDITVIGFINDIYDNNESRLNLICNKCGHKWTMKYCNLMSDKGCPNCRISKLEENVKTLLTDRVIDFEQQKRFDWLKNARQMPLDFFLPQYGVAIECQGIQHFEPQNWFGAGKTSDESFAECVKRDKLKKKMCEEHGIKIFYYSNLGIEYPYKVYEDFDNMIRDIKYHSYFKGLEQMLCETKSK